MPSHIFITSLFPHLLSYPLTAYFLLRITLAYFALCMSWDRFKKPHSYIAIFELIASLFVFVGFYTQAALIAVMLMLIFEWYADKRAGIQSSSNTQTTLVLFVIALSLMFTGPGVLAFDLPL